MDRRVFFGRLLAAPIAVQTARSLGTNVNAPVRVIPYLVSGVVQPPMRDEDAITIHVDGRRLGQVVAEGLPDDFLLKTTRRTIT